MFTALFHSHPVLPSDLLRRPVQGVHEIVPVLSPSAVTQVSNISMQKRGWAGAQSFKMVATTDRQGCSLLSHSGSPRSCPAAGIISQGFPQSIALDCAFSYSFRSSSRLFPDYSARSGDVWLVSCTFAPQLPETAMVVIARACGRSSSMAHEQDAHVAQGSGDTPPVAGGFDAYAQALARSVSSALPVLSLRCAPQVPQIVHAPPRCPAPSPRFWLPIERQAFRKKRQGRPDTRLCRSRQNAQRRSALLRGQAGRKRRLTVARARFRAASRCPSAM